MGHRFADRHQAGRMLAERLRALADQHPVVVGLARGGVPVAYEVAQALRAPLDVIVARKLGAPGNPELGLGALAEGDVEALNPDVIAALLVSAEELEYAHDLARAEIATRVERYRRGKPPQEVADRVVILVDDGLATGATARAALRALRRRGASRLILAVPVGSPDTVAALREEADEIVCPEQPKSLLAVGLWYRDFAPTQDEEVDQLLHGTYIDPPPMASDPRPVRISTAEIDGDLVVPDEAHGIVVFAHGSGSSRFSPRNRHVAAALNEAGLATLLVDLLRPEEERNRGHVFDIALLAERLIHTTRWVRSQPELSSLAIGLFGASTGAAAALCAAAALPDEIQAVISRGGRPDLAAGHLARVRAPVLLIVGGADRLLVELNRAALAQLPADSRLEIVSGATHLFEEPGALEEVGRLAGSWLVHHLAPAHLNAG
jgi:putative phosphoribosyl transferase